MTTETEVKPSVGPTEPVAPGERGNMPADGGNQRTKPDSASASDQRIPGPPQRAAKLGHQPEEDWTVVRCANGDGQGLFATRAFGYGELVLRESPLLLVPKDTRNFLMGNGTRAMIEVARRIGDASRLAVFAAFLKLSEEDRAALLSMGETNDGFFEQQTRRVISMFLQDFPDFSNALDWDLFARVVGLVNDRSNLLPGGERVVYRRSSLASHSCRPNAIVETLHDSGLKELRAISYFGIAENEEITVSYYPEEVLLLPRKDRKAKIKEARGGWTCICKCAKKCQDIEDIGKPLPLLNAICNPDAKSVEDQNKKLSDAEHIQKLKDKELRDLDNLLPFAMVKKAHARFRLGQAFEKCDGEEIVSTEMEEKAKELYIISLEETEIVLGQRGKTQLSNIKARLNALEGYERTQCLPKGQHVSDPVPLGKW